MDIKGIVILAMPEIVLPMKISINYPLFMNLMLN